MALLLALICLWLSSGAALHHTDDLSAFRAFRAGRSVDRHSAPAPAADQCVAHEWMSVWQTLSTTRPAVTWTGVTVALLFCPLAAALHRRGFEYVSLRGPPSLFS